MHSNKEKCFQGPVAWKKINLFSFEDCEGSRRRMCCITLKCVKIRLVFK